MKHDKYYGQNIIFQKVCLNKYRVNYHVKVLVEIMVAPDTSYEKPAIRNNGNFPIELSSLSKTMVFYAVPLLMRVGNVSLKRTWNVNGISGEAKRQ